MTSLSIVTSVLKSCVGAFLRRFSILLFIQNLIKARVLRLLATRHIFKEVAPNVFAHNRLSLPLDTGKDAASMAKME